MTTFVLNRYEPVADTQPTNNENPTPAPAPTEKTPEATITIAVHDSVSKIVAAALYNSMPNTVDVVEQSDSTEKATQDAIKVISTESVNDTPVDSVNFVKGHTDVVVLGSGFKTKQEDWFLTTLNNRHANVIYTMEGFVSHLKSKLGVK